jgi:prophage maintenance system killer protein
MSQNGNKRQYLAILIQFLRMASLSLASSVQADMIINQTTWCSCLLLLGGVGNQEAGKGFHNTQPSF